MRLFGVGLLAFIAPEAGLCGWPFGGDESESEPPMIEVEGDEMPAIMMGMPRGMMMGMPVMVEEGQFGFDPWEDLHKHVARTVVNKAQPGAFPLMDGPFSGGFPVMQLGGPQIVIEGGGGPPGLEGPGLALELGSLLAMMAGNFEGQVGRSEGSFEVDDDHKSRIRISAKLPGYKLGGEELSTSPLSVKVLGHRSVVVSGTQQMGPIVKTWQRSFSLPKGANTNKISVTYQEKSGNLTVDVPRDNSTEANKDDDDEDEFGGDDRFLPPVLRAMQQAMPGLIEGLDGPGHKRRQGGGFLMPPGPRGPDLADIFGQLGALHPRNHLPHSEPVPEDAQVDFIGCFAQSQMSEAELKYYGESNAAGFAGMYWHARADHTPYFAMARHDEPLGHAFTLRSFAHEKEKPKWGVYDGCGAHCEDDRKRWCGCSNEPQRGFGNAACPDETERRFSVYKISSASKEPVPSDAEAEATPKADGPPSGLTASTAIDDAIAAATAGQATPKVAETQQSAAPVGHGGRPYWQLAPSEGKTDEAPGIEIMVPKGTVPEAKGREILFFNATSPSAASTDSTGKALPKEPTEATAPTGLVEARDSEAAPVGKVRLPVGVEPSSCHYEDGKVNEDGNQVLKCQLKKDDVKQVKIKVVEEL